MEFTPRAVTFFLAFLFNLSLAGLIGWQFRKRRIARIYALSAFFAASYSWMTGGLAAAHSEGSALLWFRVFFPLSCFVVPSLFHVALVYSRQEKPWLLALLRSAYAFAALIGLLRAVDLFPGHMARHADLSWAPVADPIALYAYVPFFMVFF